MKKSADQWFSEYGECHHNPVNELLHWICIPAITLSLLGLLWSIPMPASWGAASQYLNAATLFVVAALVFYLRLSPALAVGMLAFSSLFLGLIIGYEHVGWTSALGIFFVAWILQFVGHKLEGKKPAFFKDLQFLLIGPIWLLGFIYRRVGIPY